MSFYNYSPQYVSVSFSGINITGFADGTFVEVERADDAFTKKVGAQGDVVRVQSLDRSGKITITLQNQSPCNDLLSALADADELTGVATGAMLVKDTNTLQGLLNQPLAFAQAAWIMKRPKVDRAKEATNCVWVFECAVLSLNPSGAVK